MKLSSWAKKIGIHYRTAWRMFVRGAIPGAYRLNSGSIIVPEDRAEGRQDYTVVYSRVSSSEDRSRLETQAERVAAFCAAKGWVVNEIVKECASGLNDTRPKLDKVFRERRATRIVVEHRDRLTRFGFHHIKTLLHNCEIVVINEVDDAQADIVQDFVSIITSFCARLYGKRRGKRKTEALIREMRAES